MMKIARTTVTMMLLAAAFGMSAQTMMIDTKASEVQWLGKKVTGQHEGKIMVNSGEVSMKDGMLAGVHVVMNMNSITNTDLDDSGNAAKLIGHLKSPDFFDVAKYPEAMFQATSITAIDNDGEDASYSVTGDLTIKGATHPITFDVTVMEEGNTMTTSGTATFDRSKYDVRYGSGSFFEGLGDKMIYDDVELTFNVVAKAKG